MKKIGLFLNSEPYSGGMFQYCQSIIDALESLPQKEFEVQVIFTKKDWEKYLSNYRFQNKFIEPQFLSEVIGKVGNMFFLNLWRKYSRYFHPTLREIVKLECNLWIFPCQDFYSYQVDVNSITAIHDLMHRYEKFPEITEGGEYQRRERLFSNISRYSSAILVDSECGRDQVADIYNVDNLKIFALPYVAPRYIFQEKPLNFDSLYQLPKKYLFYPAQFWYHKNHINLCHALAKVKEHHADIHLILVGSKKNGYEKVFSLIDELGLTINVTHLGYVEDKYIPVLYKRARALVMPTFFGPTNIPPLEAFALGCPVAISEIYGMRDQCKDAALYFNPLSIKEIGEAIKSLWEDDQLCKDLIVNGHLVYENWNQKHFNKGLLNIIRNFN